MKFNEFDIRLAADKSGIPHEQTELLISNLKAIFAKPKFNFRSALSEDGVEEENIEKWMRIRAFRKARNTELAFNKFKNQVTESGLSMNKVVEHCIFKGWYGFNANWINNEAHKQFDNDRFKSAI